MEDIDPRPPWDAWLPVWRRCSFRRGATNRVKGRVAGLVFNLYPVLLQRYNRGRVARLWARPFNWRRLSSEPAASKEMF
jgi:hypothetical protein